MKFVFQNYWVGSSFKDGEVFPLILFGIGGDIHPSYWGFGITILNFYFGVEKR